MKKDKQPRNAPNGTDSILLGATKAKFEGFLHEITKASRKFIGFCETQDYSSGIELTLKKVLSTCLWPPYKRSSLWLQSEE